MGNKKESLGVGLRSAYIMSIGAAMLALCTLPQTVLASGGLSFSEFAVHPYASKTGWANGQGGCTQAFCPDGETITDMGVTSSGQLIAGYGDWDGNIDSNGVSTGGIYTVPLNLSDGSWDMANAIRIGSEAMDTINEFGGNVYVSQTDPSNIPPTGYSQGQPGIVTSNGGWHFMPINLTGNPTMEHMFDMSSLDNGNKDLWVFAAHCFEWWTGCNSDEATALRSTDGGVTWTFAKTDNSAPTSTYGFERYYWGHTVNGKMFMQARGVTPATPMHIYDSMTDTWSDWGTSNQYICNAWQGKMVVDFDNHLVCGNQRGSTVTTFDGTTAKDVQFSAAGTGVQDFYVAKDGYLYILDTAGDIYRTKSLSGSFEYVGHTAGVTGTAASILVYNDSIYIGGDLGKIYKSNTTISATPLLVPELTSISATTMTVNNSTYPLYVYGRDFSSGAQVSIDGVAMTTTFMSPTQLAVQVNTSKLLSAMASRTVNVTVTNSNGQQVVLASALTLIQNNPVPNPTPPSSTITNTSSATPKTSITPSGILASTGTNMTAILGGGLVLIASGAMSLFYRFRRHHLRK